MPKADTCDLVIKSVHQMAPKTFQFHWNDGGASDGDGVVAVMLVA